VLSDTPSGGVYAVVLDELKRTPSHSLELDTSILGTQPSDAVRSVDDLQGQVVNVSISHDGDYACAVCVAPTAPPSPTAQDILEAGVLDP
jgi:holo-[acyl-carrier protein] synthase